MWLSRCRTVTFFAYAGNPGSTFPAEDSGALAALKTPAELDRYIYFVAGCVGEFWTAITVAHRAHRNPFLDARRIR